MKVLGRPTGAWRGHEVEALRDPPAGLPERSRGEAEPFLDGCRRGSGVGDHVARRVARTTASGVPGWPRSPLADWICRGVPIPSRRLVRGRAVKP